MGEEVKVRVRLDTRQAKGELRDMTRDAESTAGRVSGGIRRALGRGLRAVGFGAAIGSGIAAVRGATESGIGDVVGESLGGIGAQLAQFFLGDLDDKARSSRRAREEAIATFGTVAGIRNEISPGMRNWFDATQKRMEKEERGRQLFERDEQFRGPGLDDLVTRIMQGLAGLLKTAVQELLSGLNPIK